MIVRNTKMIMTMRTERGVEAVDTNMLLETKVHEISTISFFRNRMEDSSVYKYAFRNHC